LTWITRVDGALAFDDLVGIEVRPMSDDLEEAEDIVELGSDILEQSEALAQQFGLQLFGRVELGTETGTMIPTTRVMIGVSAAIPSSAYLIQSPDMAPLPNGDRHSTIAARRRRATRSSDIGEQLSPDYSTFSFG
jgi:hypothetical protein